MPYRENEFKTTNVNYLNKDFDSFKNALIEYAKTYYPNTYKDFNETSPGMMLIEMSSYVGDVLSFYIDQQYQEMMLPLAQERRNVVNIAKMLGYKVKPTIPALVNLKCTMTVDAVGDINNKQPDYSQAFSIDKGMKVATSDNIYFETLDIVDFTVSSSADSEPEMTTFDSDGLVTEYTLTRYVKSIGGETTTSDFVISSPEKFLELTLSEKNVIEIISVVDSGGNNWYEVPYLAQDKIPIETHYTDDSDRDTAYVTLSGDVMELPVPYTLEYIKTSKRFTVEVDEENNTTLVFGNGLLRTGTLDSLNAGFLSTEQVGITIPGEITDVDDSISDSIGNVYSTLGETPGNTTLTVTYRTGGGLGGNIPVGEITTVSSKTIATGTDNGTLEVTNEEPARGGSNGESIDEIRERTKSFFATQNRCVTKEDYEARIMNMPAKFGNIAKVYVNPRRIMGIENLPVAEIHTLSYDNNKDLVTTPDLIYNNLSNHLDQYRILTDNIIIENGYIINFGVIFEVVAHRRAFKPDVKLNCIQKIKEYFNIDNMQFRQPIYTSDLSYELMGVDGVRAVNYVCITQGENYLSPGTWEFNPPLHSINPDGSGSGGASGYGYEYNFGVFYSDNPMGGGQGIILPSVEPAVFELKNPNDNVKGIVL